MFVSKKLCQVLNGEQVNIIFKIVPIYTCRIRSYDPIAAPTSSLPPHKIEERREKKRILDGKSGEDKIMEEKRKLSATSKEMQTTVKSFISPPRCDHQYKQKWKSWLLRFVSSKWKTDMLAKWILLLQFHRLCFEIGFILTCDESRFYPYQPCKDKEESVVTDSAQIANDFPKMNKLAQFNLYWTSTKCVAMYLTMGIQR